MFFFYLCHLTAPASSTDNFLAKLPASVVKNGKIIDIRGDLKQTMKKVWMMKNYCSSYYTISQVMVCLFV